MDERDGCRGAGEPERNKRKEYDWQNPTLLGLRRLSGRRRVGWLRVCVERWVLAEDRLLKFLECWTRFDTEFFDQDAPGFAVDLECFRLPVGAVEGEDQQPTEVLAQGLLGYQRLELSNHAGVASFEVSVDPSL